METEVGAAYFKRINLFNKRNKLRQEAAFGGDALKYYTLCEELGIEYEKPFEDLYFKGADLALKKNPKGLEEKVEKNSNFSVQEVLTSVSPKVVYNARNSRTLLKGVFGKLSKIGIEVGNTKNMDTVAMLNKYMALRREHGISK